MPSKKKGRRKKLLRQRGRKVKLWISGGEKALVPLQWLQSALTASDRVPAAVTTLKQARS